MAYPGAIDAGDLTKIRYPRYRIRNLKCNVMPLIEFADAEVDTLPAEYPILDLPVTSASVNWLDCRRGEYAIVRDGSGNWIMDNIWRRNSNSTSYFKGLRFARGDSGKAVLQADALQAGHIITSYTVRVPKALKSNFDGADYQKREDLAFTSFDPSSQANLGQHRAATLATGDTTVTLEFELDTTTSTSWQVTPGTISPEWVLPDGCSFETGFDEFDNPTQIVFPPGAHILPCIVSDTERATTERSYRYVFIDGDDGGGNEYTSFSDEYKIVGITNDVRTREGRTITFECIGVPDADKIYTGAPCLLTWDDQYSNDNGATWVTPAAGTTITNVFGYVRRWSANNQGNGVEGFTFTIESPLLYAASLPFAPQYLIEAASPTKWWEVPEGLATAAFIPFYVGDLHSRFFQELHDYYPGDGADYNKFQWDISGDNMADAMRTAARPFLGYIGCDSEGNLRLTRNLNVETTANRTAAANRITIDENDVIAPIQYELNEVMAVGECEGAYFVISGEGTEAKYRGLLARTGKNARRQGVRIERMPDFIAGDSVEGKSRVGHYEQMLNAPVKVLPFQVLGSRDVYDPAWGLWVTSDMAAFDPLATPDLYNGRMVVDSITTQWTLEKGSWTKLLTYNALPESFGQPATSKTKYEFGGEGITPSTNWCYEFDFTVSDYDWTGGLANWIDETGWSYTDQTTGDGVGRRLVNIYTTFSSTTITSISFTYLLTKGTIDETNQSCLLISTSATFGAGTIQNQSYTATSNTTNGTFSWTGQQAMTAIRLFASSSRDETPTITYSGDVVIMTATICGTGANPFV